MSSTSIVFPLHYLIVRREGTAWYFKSGSRVFYNPTNVPVSLALDERLHQFCLNPTKVVVELFRISGGKPGYYLANLRDRKYHYCGLNFEDVRTTLQSLGIGRADPLER